MEEHIWLKGTHLATTHPSYKLAMKCYSPLLIIKVLSLVMYQLAIPLQWAQKHLYNVFHASLLTPYHETLEHGVNFHKPPPDVIEGEAEYEVEKVLDSKCSGHGRKLHYLLQ